MASLIYDDGGGNPPATGSDFGTLARWFVIGTSTPASALPAFGDSVWYMSEQDGEQMFNGTFGIYKVATSGCIYSQNPSREEWYEDNVFKVGVGIFGDFHNANFYANSGAWIWIGSDDEPSVYDLAGFDVFGFDVNGYDVNGFDVNGFDAAGSAWPDFNLTLGDGPYCYFEGELANGYFENVGNPNFFGPISGWFVRGVYAGLNADFATPALDNTGTGTWDGTDGVGNFVEPLTALAGTYINGVKQSSGSTDILLAGFPGSTTIFGAGLLAA